MSASRHESPTSYFLALKLIQARLVSLHKVGNSNLITDNKRGVILQNAQIHHFILGFISFKKKISKNIYKLTEKCFSIGKLSSTTLF